MCTHFVCVLKCDNFLSVFLTIVTNLSYFSVTQRDVSLDRPVFHWNCLADYNNTHCYYNCRCLHSTAIRLQQMLSLRYSSVPIAVLLFRRGTKYSVH